VDSLYPGGPPSRTSYAPLAPLIDLAPGAEENPVAVELMERIRDNLAASPRKQADFRALRGAVLMVAQDLGEALTLRFDHGRLTIHDGTVGIPSVTFCGDLAALRELVELPILPFVRLPLPRPFGGEGRDAFKHLALRLARGDLKVYGLAAHPRTVVFLLRVLSRHG
jgi:hypothetical protein